MSDQAPDFTLRVTREPASAILRPGRCWWALLPLFVLVSAFGQSDNVTHEIANLKDPDYKIRSSAARTLGTMKDPRALAPLVLALKDTFTEVRSAAIESRARLKDPRAIGVLIPLSTDENEEIRNGAILALGEFQDQRAVAALIAALNQSNEMEEEVPASSLGRIGALAVDLLLAQLKSGNPEVRMRAVNALGWIEIPRAFDALIPALKDPNSAVRAAAVEGIYGQRDVPALLLTPFDLSRPFYRRDPREARDPRVIDLLIAALQDADLGELGTPRAVVPLLALVNTPAARRATEVEVRISAVEAFGQIKDPGRP